MSGIQSVAPVSVPRPWRKAFGANHTGAFPTADPDLAASQAGALPASATGRAVISFGQHQTPQEIHIVPFGAGSADQTVKIRVWGYRACSGGYIGTLLWAGTCTLCAQGGTAGFDVAAADLYCDAITTTVGTESVDCRTTSPGSDLPAKVKILTAGSEFLAIEADKDGATSVNALVGGE